MTDESEVAKLLLESNNKGVFKPVVQSKSIVLSWERDSDSYGKYRVWIAQNENLAELVYQTKTVDSYVAVDGLLPGKYFWKVMDSTGKESDVDT